MPQSPSKNLSPNNINSSHQTWVGRFAPSPTGSLHMGSLAAAVASYMIAKQKLGKWLVRIEDIDKQREVEGAADSILTSLEAYGLYWDDEILYQSNNREWHRHLYSQLIKTDLLYFCDCSRADLNNRNSGVYDGYCRNKEIQKTLQIKNNLNDKNCAVRIQFSSASNQFKDFILGQQRFFSAKDKQDFIVKRRDGILAYQFVVVADDIYQKIDHVVRGTDLLDSTHKQVFLFQQLNQPAPDFYHIPLIKDEDNLKLSKSIKSPSLKQVEYLQDQKLVIPRSEILLKIFEHLGQTIEPSLHTLKPRKIIEYYLDNWDTDLML